MSDTPAPPAKAIELGHAPEWDPPFASAAQRWTCPRPCGATVLQYGRNVYGSATTSPCTVPRFRPARTEDEQPAVQIGEVLIFTYLHDGTLHVTVDTEGANRAVDIRVNVNNGAVFARRVVPASWLTEVDAELDAAREALSIEHGADSTRAEQRYEAALRARNAVLRGEE